MNSQGGPIRQGVFRGWSLVPCTLSTPWHGMIASISTIRPQMLCDLSGGWPHTLRHTHTMGGCGGDRGEGDFKEKS